MKFIIDYPALFIEKLKSLIISDLHIGIEYCLAKSGIRVSKQIEKFKEDIYHLQKLTNASQLIILGDVKHKVPGTSIQEYKDIPKFFESLVKIFKKIIVVRGNHDADLHYLIPNIKIYSSRGFKLEKYGFFHGHAWPSAKLMQCDYLFMGHLQPAIEFKDDLGYRSIQQVWLKGKLNKNLIKKKYKIKRTGKLNLVVLPSFNRLAGCLAVNKILEGELIGPLVVNKILDIDESKAYLLDGTLLGKVMELKK